MIGTIAVEHLEIECIVGILPDERVTPQTLFVDIELDYDFAAAAASEHVDDTVDYVALAQTVTSLAVDRQYQLIETYAEEAASRLLRQFGGERVSVRIKKPAAVPAARWTSVFVERRP